MRVSRLLLTVAVASAVAACSSTKIQEKPPTPVAEAPRPPVPTPPPPVVAAPQPTATPIDPLNDPNSILARRSVYFDFDQSSIKSDSVALIEAHGHYLAEHPARAVRVEGNCDERGGREYNLALGQRRADAVAGRLRLLGVAAGQVEAVSFGKERPKAVGHDEASWAENRRDDIVYK